ncbi:MAG: hypothetical protein KDE14_15455 [Rhodobacteraceae bacterium]|nr:hypothetical protein [Paracoccaceae bacterium]
MRSISIATSKFFVRTIEAVLLLVVAAAAIAVWRLSQGPLDLDEFVLYLENNLNEATPGIQFEIAHAQLSWQERRRRPLIEVSDVRLRAPDGTVVASLGSMEAAVDIVALLGGDVRVEHIGLFSPIIRFNRDLAGEIQIGLEQREGADARPVGNDGVPTDAQTVDWFAMLLAPPDLGPAALASLDSVEVRNSTLIFTDQKAGARWLVPNAELQFLRQSDDIQVGASLPILDGEKTIEIDLAGRYVYAARTLALTASFAGVRPAQLSAIAGLSPDIAMADVPLTGSVDTTLVFADNVPQLSFLTFDIASGPGRLSLPESIGGPRTISSGFARGSINSDFDQAAIERLTLTLDGIDGQPELTMSGTATGLRASPTIDVSASVPSLTLSALAQLWPEGVKPNTLDWIKKNLSDGSLSGLSARANMNGFDLESLRVADLDLGVDFAGLTVNYLTGLPKIENTSGRLNMNLTEAAFDIRSGEIPDVVSGKGLRVTGADLRMGDLTQLRQFANFSIDIAGDLDDTLRLIDHAPLKYASAMGIDPNDTSGSNKIKLKLTFPLIKDLRLSDLEIDVRAQVENAHVANVAFGLPLNDGMMSLRVTTQGLDAEGTAKLGPIRTGLTWRENFGGGDFRSQYALDVILENDQRELVALGRAPFIPPYIDGPVRTEVVYRVMRDGTASLAAAADLTNVAMSLKQLGWNKAVGEPAKGEAEVSLKDGKLVSVDRFAVESGSTMAISGHVTFGAENALQSLSVRDGIVGETHLSVEMAAADDGVIELDVAGPAFDASYFWKDLNDDEDSDWVPVRLRANIGRMWLTKMGSFERVKLKFERDQHLVRRIDFESAVGENSPFTFKLSSNEGLRSFSGGSTDGGAVIRSIGLFDDIIGGQLKIEGKLAEEGAIDGRMDVDDFKLVQAPLVARLLSVAALTGIVDELEGTGISFRELKVPFSYASDKLSIRDGGMFGTSLGMTMSGDYDFANSYIDFEGTLVPAYALNSVFNFIPLVGDILSGGEKGSGIFAATYRWQGPVATAQPTVNPLAALAPGFLRRIFSIFDSAPPEAKNESEPAAPDADSGQTPRPPAS